MECQEIVCYRIKSGHRERFSSLHRVIHDRLASQPGFLGAEHYVSIKKAGVCVDITRWVDEAAAAASYRAYRDFEEAAAFEACVAEVIHAGHFVRGDAF